jgi:hypothetical protein
VVFQPITEPRSLALMRVAAVAPLVAERTLYRTGAERVAARVDRGERQRFVLAFNPV